MSKNCFQIYSEWESVVRLGVFPQKHLCGEWILCLDTRRTADRLLLVRRCVFVFLTARGKWYWKCSSRRSDVLCWFYCGLWFCWVVLHPDSRHGCNSSLSVSSIAAQINNTSQHTQSSSSSSWQDCDDVCWSRLTRFISSYQHCSSKIYLLLLEI